MHHRYGDKTLLPRQRILCPERKAVLMWLKTTSDELAVEIVAELLRGSNETFKNSIY